MTPETYEAFPTPEYDIDFDGFWSQWGEECGISKEVFRDIWTESEQLISDYEYHNFGHVRKTLRAAMEICDQQEADNPLIKINRRVLILGVAYHDASYDKAPHDFGFDSKEAHSTAIMRRLAPKHGFSEAEIDQAAGIIMATKLFTAPQTLEEEIMIAADISNVGQDYEYGFKKSYLDFASETAGVKAANNEDFSMLSFSCNSVKILCSYVGVLDQNCKFVSKAVPNLRRFVRELAHQQHQSAIEYVLKLNDPMVNKVLGYSFLKKKD